jgi:hypothetical protein
MGRATQPLILKRLGADEGVLGTVLSLQFAVGGIANAFLLAPLTSLLGGGASGGGNSTGGVRAVVSRCLAAMGFLFAVRAAIYYRSGVGDVGVANGGGDGGGGVLGWLIAFVGGDAASPLTRLAPFVIVAVLLGKCLHSSVRATCELCFILFLNILRIRAK